MWIRAGLVLWGLLVGAVTVRIAGAGPGFSTTEGTWEGVGLLLAAGCSLTIASAVALSRPSRRRLAWLLTATATSWFLAEWANPAAPAPAFTIGLCLGAATPALVYLAALTDDDWRGSRLAAMTAVAGLVIMIGLVGLLGAASFDPKANGCPDCPTNLVDLGHDPGRWLQVSHFGLVSATAWLIAALLVLVDWLRRSLGRRRDAWRVAVAAVFLVIELAKNVRSLDAGFLVSDAESRLLWRYQAVTLVALAVVVVVDMIRARAAERSLTRVVRGLATGENLLTGLAERLDDPSLVIAYPSADGAKLLDAAGAPAAPIDSSGRLATSIGPAQAPIAVLGHRPDIAPRRVRELAAAAAAQLALDHERLQAQALAQLFELRRSGARIVAAGDLERRRLERDLHDGAQQNLVTLLLRLRLAQAEQPEYRALTLAEEHLIAAIDDLRNIAHGLYPVLLERAGLAPALSALGETRPIRLEALPGERFERVIESTIYLLVDRATNQAPSSVWVRTAGERICVEILVDGQLPDLHSLQDRVAALSGTISIDSASNSVRVVALLPQTAEKEVLTPKSIDFVP